MALATTTPRPDAHHGALPTRNEIVRLFGTPSRTEGSVNEARLQSEHGIEFNEKWVYSRPRNEPTRPLERIVYWRRYAFVASARLERSGQWVQESPSELLAREPAGGH